MDYLNHVKQQIISERKLGFLNLKKKKEFLFSHRKS